MQAMNNLFIGNESYNGGGIDLYHPAADSKAVLHPKIVNNTFYDNNANFGGGIRVNCETNLPVIFNNIFWENESPNANEVYYISSTNPIFIFNCLIDTNEITGAWSGEGNITGDPMFLDPGNDDFCIEPCGSPCVAAGIDSLFIDGFGLYSAPDHDFYGNPRPFPDVNHPDIGACEVEDCPSIIEESRFDPGNPESNFNLKVSPNPTRRISDIRYQITCPPTGGSDIRYVKLEVYNICGQKVRTLVQEEQKPGEYVVGFNGSDLPGGIYFVRLSVGASTETCKLIMVK